MRWVKTAGPASGRNEPSSSPFLAPSLRFPLRFTPFQGKYPMAGISLKDFCRPDIRPLRQRPRIGGENPPSRTLKKGGSKEKQKSPYSSLAFPASFFVGKFSFVATRQSGWERFFLEFSPSTVSEKRQVFGRLGAAPLSLPPPSCCPDPILPWDHRRHAGGKDSP